MSEDKKKWNRCEHLFGINEVRVCTKLGVDCPSPKKCVEKHGDKHYTPIEFTDNGKYNFWGF
ncbi:hypothetical protein KKA03_01725 [archaeon]|nr:hypothetical protein [archaeon]